MTFRVVPIAEAHIEGFYAVFDAVARGKAKWNEPLTVTAAEKASGSGVIAAEFSDGVQLPLRDVLHLMIVLSDNTATNLLLDRIVIRRVWEKMEALGLPHTKVHSKTFLRISSVAMDSSAKYGLGVTTPNEMARLFEMLAKGKAVSPAADSAMLDILEHNENGEKLQRYVYGVRAAHKSGETDQVRTECSLYYLRNRVVACVLTKENVDQRYSPDTEAHLTIGRMGEAIVNAWGGIPKS